ncbi:AAA family ATPase [Microbacterium sp. LMI1x-1-1.1]|uniref:AAA family ATPase n=1 Tax=Microbacterium sp. LMI1x-1-1.1 TaxID=3135246 RepID=UPI0034223A78
MRTVTRIEIVGLFGYARHEVHLRSTEPTIVVAPNGAGKTHVLRLTAAALALDGQTLVGTIYNTLKLEFSDGKSLVVEREISSDGPTVRMSASSSTDEATESIRFTLAELESERALPPGFVKTASGRWYNERTGTHVTENELRRRYDFEADVLATRVKKVPAIAELCGGNRPVFIDTWRLDARAEDSRMLGEWGGRRIRSSSAAASRIRGYTQMLSEEITEARRASVQATQSADLSFARRALQGARSTIRESDLHKRYDETVERYEALARNGLAVGERPMAFPDKTTPTDRRILSVFLDDWDRRLEPLLPVNEKLEALRDILDTKLAPSGKVTSISARGGLEFHNAAGHRLPVARLSSGEQHLVALFTLLLFAARPGSLVLIDEPEISLHAAWKHAFLADITRVAALSNLQVVLATHSAGIINGRWDLTEELELASQIPLMPADDLDDLNDDFDE